MQIRFKHRFILICAVVMTQQTPSARAQPASETPQVRAVRLPGDGAGLAIDGVLAEAVWQNAPAASGFRQREPDEGAPATETTEVRVLFDEHTLYISVAAHDRAPAKVISRILQRDKIMEAHPFSGRPLFAGDDAVAILLDSFHDHRNAMVFATNPNGAEFDALITDEGREFNIDWRAVWQVAAKRTADGWSAEFAIPFRTLRYPENADGAPWGFNVYRMIRRKNEEVLWSGWSRDGEGFERVSRAGHLQGMHDLPRPGLNLEVKPFTLSRGTQDYAEGSGRTDAGELDAGIDAKWEVRPGLSLDLTVNTDFAQVEVDDEQVNLDRFELFFPEKRDFFLENAGIFEFGLRNPFEPPPFLLFFSRRIGIADDGPVPIIAGARLTGRVGNQTVGLLNVVTGEAYGEAPANYSVARLKRDIGGSNYFGLMLTDRRTRRGANTGAGIDWTYWLTGTLNVQGFVARTFTRGRRADNAYRLALDMTGDKIGFTVQHIMVGAETQADMGFITRTEIRRTDAFFRVSPRPQTLGLRRIDIFNGGQYVSNLAGEKQDWTFGPFVSLTWNSGENLAGFYNTGEILLDDGFDMADSVYVPADAYRLQMIGGFFNTSRNRPLVLGLSATHSNNFGGTLVNVGSTLRLAVGANLKLTVGYNRNKIDLPNGAFDADIGSLRLDYAFSTRLFANLFLQYNQVNRALSWNLRLNFIHRPGSDIFLVLNEQRGSSASVWDTQDREAVVKVTYLARL